MTPLFNITDPVHTAPDTAHAEDIIISFDNHYDDITVTIKRENGKFVVRLECAAPEIGMGEVYAEYDTYENALVYFLELVKNECESVET
mgnify:CR=1 FL=1